MTPPPAVGHAAHTRAFLLRPLSARSALGALPRVLTPRAWPRVRLIVDIAVLYLGASLALLAGPTRAVSTDNVLAGGFPLIVLALLYARRGPDERLQGSMLDTAAYILGVVSLATMVTVALDSVLGGTRPVELALRLWLFAAVYLSLARVMLVSIRRQAMSTQAWSAPTLIVGAGVVGEHLMKRLSGDPRYGLRPVGFLDADPRPRVSGEQQASAPVLGRLTDLDQAIETTGARHVILAFSTEPDHVLVEKVRACQQRGVDVSLVPRLYEAINDRATLDHVGGLPLVSLRAIDPRGWQFALKHALDSTVASLALVALAPVMLLMAAAIKLSSPGPILFRQRRVGRDGRVFDLLKFRTMREAAGRPQFEPANGCAPGGVEGIDRRTRIGRLMRTCSLDELPQLINVLRGDMSLVGPRPERPEFVERFELEIARYQDRHRVRSGMTGWAQVHGLRGQTSISDRVEWDNYYVQNWSLRLDLRIIALTIAEVLRFRG